MSHDKTHIIIDYEEKNNKCNIHNEILNSYCDTCKSNICMHCESNHNNHKLISDPTNLQLNYILYSLNKLQFHNIRFLHDYNLLL